MSAERPPLWLSFCPACGTAMAVGQAATAARCPKCSRRIAYPSADQFGAAEWDVERRPENLLGGLTLLDTRVGERKRRLALVAVARAACGWCVDGWFRHALAVAECWADGCLAPTSNAVHTALFRIQPPRANTDSYDAWRLAHDMRSLTGPLISRGLRPGTRARFADAYRELFPNPFLPVAWNPEWFTPTARGLARHIYDSHDFGAMPILADALQDAGCDDEQVLAHCRCEKPHARGCWVLDAVLGL